MYSKIALLLTAAVFASAQTSTQVAELSVLLQDVSSNLADYMSLATTPGTGFSLEDMPSGVLSIGMALATATDDSYTSMYSEVDFAGISSMLTELPWYTSRLKSQIDSILGYDMESLAADTTAAGASTTTAAAASTSAAPTTTSTAAAATSSVATASSTTSTAVASTAAASSVEASSSAAAASSVEASSSAAASSKASVVSTKAAVAASSTIAAVSQITDGQIQATVAQQTENGAAKAVVGMGALAAAAALLL
ncbi:hypothetical protein NCAS_0I00660 [Naumovozyma castellii]|uniref:Uncharacterized protein n=1 Tax=Naumovozyma castellii TaxID=27288 RepID=G0VJQ3_NAUCA|nr:hypothetical protein NCAS_0I00660 [Naumovozyma castellii CBS 4309]CCC71734.1 hypothetical protein NCAS_0I00660 [Naumovozyma castellii CBS 4309]